MEQALILIRSNLQHEYYSIMWYVNLLESIDQNWTYVGFTDRLKERIREHNAGKNQSTKAYAPFKLAAFVAVDSRKKVRNLEKYFKTGSGIA